MSSPFVESSDINSSRELLWQYAASYILFAYIALLFITETAINLQIGPIKRFIYKVGRAG